MSCECAIVGSQGMPVFEVINHGSEGLLVPVDDHQALSLTIDKLGDHKLQCFLGQNARKRHFPSTERLHFLYSKVLFILLLHNDTQNLSSGFFPSSTN